MSLNDECLFLSPGRGMNAAVRWWIPHIIRVLMLCLCKMEKKKILYQWSSAVWCQTTHTKTHIDECLSTYIFVRRLMTNTTLSVTHTHTGAHMPAIIRHCVTVAVQGETEESFDRVSDNVQCLLLHSFSITRQYARSTLAAANSFSLADLHLRAPLPISSLCPGFLE